VAKGKVAKEEGGRGSNRFANGCKVTWGVGGVAGGCGVCRSNKCFSAAGNMETTMRKT